MDLLNEAMIQQHFILIRRQVTFIIHPSDEKVDGSWVPRIELSELPSRGKTELVQVLIPLKTLSVEDTAPEVAKLLTPFGTVSMLSKTNTLVILDTAGNINRIYQTIKEVEDGLGAGDILTHVCKYKQAAELAETLKTLLTDKLSHRRRQWWAGLPAVRRLPAAIWRLRPTPGRWLRPAQGGGRNQGGRDPYDYGYAARPAA